MALAVVGATSGQPTRCINRMFTSMPSWVALPMHTTLKVDSDPQRMRQMEIIDHSPVSCIFSKRTLAPANKRPTPNTIFRHIAFRRLYDVWTKHFQLERFSLGRNQVHQRILCEVDQNIRNSLMPGTAGDVGECGSLSSGQDVTATVERKKTSATEACPAGFLFALNTLGRTVARDDQKTLQKLWSARFLTHSETKFHMKDTTQLNTAITTAKCKNNKKRNK